ncbi:DUF192 domain-containing protein [Patescibacteria group bacterium]|nr:DUF192 domain-containing protein [Patescibacteria group bacterium]MBU4022795.1 DUF192 domain-containing protein [Patescibacteria group bacterium]MBU4162378.1 DUF192 domain-containing protein [Patescibacteria group bacterium]
MFKSFVILILLFCLFLVAVTIFVFFLNNRKDMRINEVCFGDKCFEVEVAETAEQRTKGLMGRSDLPENKGMLFVFQEQGGHGFWMKNMMIPIDIVWMDKDLKITHIEHNVMPCDSDPCPVYKPNLLSQYVLEIKAGLAQELDIKIGDSFYFKNNNAEL